MTTADERPGGEAVSPSETVAAERVESERPDPDRIQADIEETRQELGRTVEALSAKLDVKARTGRRLGVAKEQVLHGADAARLRTVELGTRAKEAVTDERGRPRPVVPVGAFVVVVATVATTAWMRRRRR